MTTYYALLTQNEIEGIVTGIDIAHPDCKRLSPAAAADLDSYSDHEDDYCSCTIGRNQIDPIYNDPMWCSVESHAEMGRVDIQFPER